MYGSAKFIFTRGDYLPAKREFSIVISLPAKVPGHISSTPRSVFRGSVISPMAHSLAAPRQGVDRSPGR